MLNEEQLKKFDEIFHGIFEPVMLDHQQELNEVMIKVNNFKQWEREQELINAIKENVTFRHSNIDLNLDIPVQETNRTNLVIGNNLNVSDSFIIESTLDESFKIHPDTNVRSDSLRLAA